MIVAKLTYDHLDKRKGDLNFSYSGFVRFYTVVGQVTIVPKESYLIGLPQTKFKLYDDDDILYFDGWLKNDEECMVQQFVLSWAMADSGCTIIKVKIDDEWKAEIS